MPVGPVKEVEAYLAGVPEPSQAALRKLRHQVRVAAPDADEGMGYGVPGFYLGGRPLLYYGAAKSHCAIYGAMPTGKARHAAELASYKVSKGTIRFAPERPLPSALVRKLVKARVAELGAAAAARAPTRSARAGKT